MKCLKIFQNCLAILFSLFNTVSAEDAFNTQTIAIEARNFSSSDSNWIFSPLSASACLSMIYVGADGRTADELRNALSLSQNPDTTGKLFNDLMDHLNHQPNSPEDFQLNIVQGIWVHSDFQFSDHYIKTMRADFKAAIESVDFIQPILDEINGWFADQTGQKIQNLLSPSELDSSTRLVLGNALYFKGSWLEPFDSNNTSSLSFVVSSSETKDVSAMQQLGYFPYFEDADWQAILLPCKKNDSTSTSPACLFLLPKNESLLTTDRLEQILASLKRSFVRLQIPKFSIEQRFDLQELLQHLGVTDAFGPRANFSKMTDRADLYLNKVVHKCFFSINEQGVEAAAATAAAMNKSCCPPPNPATFIADRPFEFLLLDQTSHACLMIGHIADPTK